MADTPEIYVMRKPVDFSREALEAYLVNFKIKDDQPTSSHYAWLEREVVQVIRLDTQAGLRGGHWEVWLYGHASRTHRTYTAEDNIDLSKRRAAMIKQHLIQRLGDKVIVTTHGTGMYKAEQDGMPDQVEHPFYRSVGLVMQYMVYPKSEPPPPPPLPKLRKKKFRIKPRWSIAVRSIGAWKFKRYKVERAEFEIWDPEEKLSAIYQFEDIIDVDRARIVGGGPKGIIGGSFDLEMKSEAAAEHFERVVLPGPNNVNEFEALARLTGDFPLAQDGGTITFKFTTNPSDILMKHAHVAHFGVDAVSWPSRKKEIRNGWKFYSIAFVPQPMKLVKAGTAE